MATKKVNPTKETGVVSKGSKKGTADTPAEPADTTTVPPTTTALAGTPAANVVPPAKEPIIVQVDDNSEESRLFSITERLFDDLSKNPKFNLAQVGGLSISLPDGGALKLTKENVEKITVLHLLYKKLLENEPEALQKQYRKEYGPRIGKLVQAAGDAPLNIQELVKEIFQKLPPEKRTQKPLPPAEK